MEVERTRRTTGEGAFVQLDDDDDDDVLTTKKIKGRSDGNKKEKR
jgi:hypothetical protein